MVGVPESFRKTAKSIQTPTREDMAPREKVDHPPHYNVGKIEVIDFIEDQKLGFHLGNVVKYVCRAEHKGKTKEDLEKASWYLKRHFDSL